MIVRKRAGGGGWVLVTAVGIQTGEPAFLGRDLLGWLLSLLLPLLLLAWPCIAHDDQPGENSQWDERKHHLQAPCQGYHRSNPHMHMLSTMTILRNFDGADQRSVCAHGCGWVAVGMQGRCSRTGQDQAHPAGGTCRISSGSGRSDRFVDLASDWSASRRRPALAQAQSVAVAAAAAATKRACVACVRLRTPPGKLRPACVSPVPAHCTSMWQ